MSPISNECRKPLGPRKQGRTATHVLGAGMAVTFAATLAACAPPKPFETGVVQSGFVACVDYSDIQRAEGAVMPDGCFDASGRGYEVIVSAERFTLVDLDVPTDDGTERVYVLRRGL